MRVCEVSKHKNQV